MKRILSILSVATLFVLIGCTDSNDDMEIVYDSIIEPDFTVAAAEIVAGVTPVTFTNTTSVEGTTRSISGTSASRAKATGRKRPNPIRSSTIRRANTR